MSSLFVTNIAADPLIWAQHDPMLVALSVLLAVGSSIMAMHMVTLVQRARSAWVRSVSHVSAVLALGCGVWAMHFVGMLAYRLCAHGEFDPWITVISMAPSLVASAVALAVLNRRNVAFGHIALGGLLMGAGIGTMHYVGMSAAALSALIRYDLWDFLISIAVAVALSMLALWIRFGLKRRRNGRLWQATLVSGCVMGTAIAAMHYAGMAAVRVVGPVPLATPDMYANQMGLALGITAVTVFLSLLVIAVNVLLRYRQLLLQSLTNEAQLRAVVETAVDGIVMVDSTGEIRAFNGAAERMLGWSATEIVGDNISLLMPPSLPRERYDAFFDFLRFGKNNYMAHGGRDVYALHKNGRLVPIRMSGGRLKVPGQGLFVVVISDLTQRRAMEASLQRSEKQLSSLIANIPGVTFRIALENEWPTQFISESVLELSGWQPEDFLAGRINMLTLAVPEDRDMVASAARNSAETGEPYRIEYRILRRDGKLRWVAEAGRSSIDDATQQKFIEGVLLDNTAFKKRDAEFEGVVKSLERGGVVSEFDMQGNLLHANQQFSDLIGYSIQELRGMNHEDFCDPADKASGKLDAFWQRLMAGESQTDEYLRIGRGGKKLWVHINYNPILGIDGTPFKVMAFTSDLTFRRAMEQELRAAKDKAEKAAAARSTFLANMSHEIRTPMNAVLGFTGVLLDSSLNPTQRRQLETAHQAARSLLRLLNDILDSAKLEKGAVLLEIADFEVRSMIEQVLASMGPSASKKSLNLRIDIASSVPAYLRGDAFRVQQILLNLLGNAIKFTERGGVSLQARYEGGRFSVAVQDTGIGIDAAHLQSIFDPFSQADASTTRQFGGTGLGTTISRQLAETMGGQLEVRSTLGEGSTFTLTLPLPMGQAPTPESVQGKAQLPRLRILLVDDVPHNLELLQITLAAGQHEMVLAKDGEEAVEACANTLFDLVLMDLQMPVMDGLEATRSIRAHERIHEQPRTPIIALSASVLEQDQLNAQHAGMDGFASKPLDPPRLMAEIVRVLREVGHHHALRAQPDSEPKPFAAARPDNAADASPQLTIAWDQGVQLWMSYEKLHTAIAQFLKHNSDIPQRVRSLLDARDWPPMLQLAHRLRGGAGNLSLLRLATAARLLEKAATDQNPLAVQAHSRDLPSLLEEVREALKHMPTMESDGRGATTEAVPLDPTQLTSSLALPANSATGAAPPPDSVQADAPPSLSTTAREATVRAMEQLVVALQSNALEEDAMAVLHTHLPANHVRPLADAIDNFDFSQALQILHALQAQWPESSTEVSP